MHDEKTQKNRGFWPLRLALFVVAGAALVTLVLWQTRIADKRTQLSALQAQIAVQETRNAEIRKMVDSLESEEGLLEFAEKKAREEQDYAKPGEFVFIDVGGSN